jgi:site-specific DNA-cytosine methylase
MLPMLIIQGYQHSLPNNITLLKAPNFIRIGPIDLVIFKCSCQNLSHVGMGQGFSNPKLGLLRESIHVAKDLQHTQMHPCAYLLENVPPFGDYWPIVLVGRQ